VEHLAFKQGPIDEDDELDSLKGAHHSLAELRDAISFGEPPDQARLYVRVRCAPLEGRDIRAHSAILSFGLTGEVNNMTALGQRE
jgi:hypothetical protein